MSHLNAHHADLPIGPEERNEIKTKERERKTTQLSTDIQKKERNFRLESFSHSSLHITNRYPFANRSSKHNNHSSISSVFLPSIKAAECCESTS